jgi:hypothetical protein
MSIPKDIGIEACGNGRRSLKVDELKPRGMDIDAYNSGVDV